MPSPANRMPVPTSPDSATDQITPDLGKSPQEPISQGQAEAILADLKIVKQRLLWVLVIVGFFAARALFFHY